MRRRRRSFSALQRAEIAEIRGTSTVFYRAADVSVLFNEPKLLKFCAESNPLRSRKGFSALQRAEIAEISIELGALGRVLGFSALQRAEIAEIELFCRLKSGGLSFSALQRAEIAEIACYAGTRSRLRSFSALQRAEIAEIFIRNFCRKLPVRVSVLFNEPKLLKWYAAH